jgi:RNA polymerase sigma-70 factor (ECF subfamily)
MQPVEEDLLAGLLMASAAGDQHAFAELYRLTAPRLNAVVRRIAGSAVDASGLLQETYVKIWSRAAKFDPARGAAIDWMVAIARHTAIDLRRSKARSDVSLDAVTELPDTVETELGAGMDVRRCLTLIEPNYAQVIILAFYSGYSHSEMARRLDMPLGTIKSWVRRGLLSLKECLGSRGQ